MYKNTRIKPVPNKYMCYRRSTQSMINKWNPNMEKGKEKKLKKKKSFKAILNNVGSLLTK